MHLIELSFPPRKHSLKPDMSVFPDLIDDSHRDSVRIGVGSNF